MTRRYFFKSYRRFYRLSCRFRARVSPGGRLLIGALIASAVFGLDVRKSFAFQMFALCVTLLVGSLVGAVLTRGRFEVRRSFPRFATRGRHFDYEAEITNVGKLSAGGVRVREDLDVKLPTFEAFSELREPGFAKRNWFDRYMGYPRWAWVVRICEGVAAEEFSVPVLRPGESAKVKLGLTPNRRGQISARGLTVLLPEPLGLLRHVIRIACPDTVLVLPPIIALPILDFGLGRRHRAVGFADGRTFGGVDELKGLREFRPGDPLRRMDWRASARLGEPMVKEFHDERYGGLTIFLDTDAPTHCERFEDAVTVVASLVAAAPHGDPAELALVRPARGNVGEFVSTRGRESALMTLASVNAAPLAPERQARVVQRSLRADAVIAILQDWDAGRAALVDTLRRLTDGRVLIAVVREPGAPVRPDVTCLRGDSLAADLAVLLERCRFEAAKAA